MDFKEVLGRVQARATQLSKRQWIGIGAAALLLFALFGAGSGSDIALDSSGRHTCESIIPAVQDLSKEKGPEIFEINQISLGREWTQGWPSVSCSGLAQTSAGSQYVNFGTEVSPQGNLMVTLQYPNGIM